MIEGEVYLYNDFFFQITKCLNNHKAIESVYWLRSVGTINNFLLKDR